MKKINRLSSGIGLFMAVIVAIGGIIVLTPPRALADAASDYCTKKYPSPKDGTDVSVTHTGDLRKACVQGYNKDNCNGFKADYTTSAAQQEEACSVGQQAATAAKSSSGTGTACETAILPKSLCGSGDHGGVWGILLLVINILTAGVGIIAIGGFVFAAFLYASAADNASQIQKSKEIMQNVVIGIVAFALMYAFLQFLIPGGVFNG